MTNEIHSQIERLKSNLQELDSARTNILRVTELATQIADNAGLIIKSQEAHQSQLSIKIDKHLNESAVTIKDAVKSVSDAGGLVVEKQEDYHQRLSKKIDEQLEEFGMATNKGIEEAMNPLKSLVNMHRDSLADFQGEVQEYIEGYERLVNVTKLLVEEIEKINFPQRLDKIDASITSINIGLQNIQTEVARLKNDTSSSASENRASFQEIKSEFSKFDVRINDLNTAILEQIDNGKLQIEKLQTTNKLIIVLLLLQFIGLVLLGLHSFRVI